MCTSGGLAGVASPVPQQLLGDDVCSPAHSEFPPLETLVSLSQHLPTGNHQKPEFSPLGWSHPDPTAIIVLTHEIWANKGTSNSTTHQEYNN